MVVIDRERLGSSAGCGRLTLGLLADGAEVELSGQESGVFRRGNAVLVFPNVTRNLVRVLLLPLAESLAPFRPEARDAPLPLGRKNTRIPIREVVNTTELQTLVTLPLVFLISV